METHQKGRRLFLAHAATVGSALVAPRWGQADTYPSKPIKLVVGFGPGGTSDVLARALSVRLSAILKQSVFVENRPGANGIVAAESVSRAEPDGYTLHVAAAALAVNSALRQDLRYDPVSDLTPITLIGRTVMVLCVNPAMKINSLGELIAYAKAHPKEVNYGSGGQGSSNHLTGAMLASMAGVEMTHIPYSGDGQTMTALLANEISVGLPQSPTALPFVRSGRVRALAQTGSERSTLFPDVPLVSETLPGFNASSWQCLVGPKGMPKAIASRLNDVVVKFIRSKEGRDLLAGLAMDPVGSTPEELQAVIAEDTVKWRRAAQIAKVTM